MSPSRLVILDAGPTGLASKPRGNLAADACRAWIEGLKRAGVNVAVPEIARYEVRRELVRSRAVAGLLRLDALHPGLAFLPITGDVMDLASELWGHVRRLGLPTAGDEALDGDAILAAHALIAATLGDAVIIATTNVGHMARFPGVVAADWRTIV